MALITSKQIANFNLTVKANYSVSGLCTPLQYILYYGICRYRHSYISENWGEALCEHYGLNNSSSNICNTLADQKPKQLFAKS